MGEVESLLLESIDELEAAGCQGNLSAAIAASKIGKALTLVRRIRSEGAYEVDVPDGQGSTILRVYPEDQDPLAYYEVYLRRLSPEEFQSMEEGA